MLIDTHCHLYFDAFDADREAVIQRMHEAGVSSAVVVGIDPATNELAHTLAAGYPELRYSVGLHPATELPADIDVRDALLPWMSRQPRPLAIGECGIDLHWETNPLQRQQELFRQQLELARDLGLPVIVHSRAADRETCDVLAAVDDVRCVLHCFNGSPLLLDLAIARAWYVSFAGNLTFQKARELHEAAQRLPLEQLLVETDAPFLAPHPWRGRRCEPAYVVHTAHKLAELRGLPVARMHEVLSANARYCFNPS